MNTLRHLAIIMDGNGRWAQARGHQRIFGHVRGAQVAKRMITECTRRGLPYLTLYAFSTENWSRPLQEVSVLMKILRKYLLVESKTLMKENIRFRYIGDLSRLPAEARVTVENTVQETASNTGLTLTFALNYGGRQELVKAAQTLAADVLAGRLGVESIDEARFSQALQTAYLPDTDLVIRTSGEFRISNFMLWSAAYAEFHITPIAWPDFTESDLSDALLAFSRRERRFGTTGTGMAKNSVGGLTKSN